MKYSQHNTAKEDADLAKAEIILSNLLRYGVVFSAILIGLGLLAEFLSNKAASGEMQSLIASLTQGHEIKDYHPLSGFTQLFQGALHWNSEALISSGLLVLIGLPIARVGMTVILFLLEKDWLFLLITLFVFLVLMTSIFLGSVI